MIPLRVRLLMLLVLAALIAAGVTAYFRYKPFDAPPGVHMDARPAAAVARAETQPLILDFPLRVYAPAVKKKLDLPAAVQQDAARHVVASTLTAADERRHTVTTVLDAETGEFGSYDRAEPLPWIAVNTRSQVGVFYGIKGGAPVLRLQGQQEFLQVKAAHLGAVGTLDSDGAYFVGVGAWARW